MAPRPAKRKTAKQKELEHQLALQSSEKELEESKEQNMEWRAKAKAAKEDAKKLQDELRLLIKVKAMQRKKRDKLTSSDRKWVSRV